MSTPPASSAARGDSARLWDSVVGGDLNFLIARTNAISLSAADAALASHGLRVRSYSVLALAAGNARPSQRELSEFLRLDPSQIVALVDELESKGLVRRESDPADRRANVVVCTDLGRRVHRLARASAKKVETAMIAGFQPEELDVVIRVLRRFAEAPDS